MPTRTATWLTAPAPDGWKKLDADEPIFACRSCPRTLPDAREYVQPSPPDSAVVNAYLPPTSYALYSVDEPASGRTA